jgi:ribosomal protein S16
MDELLLPCAAKACTYFCSDKGAMSLIQIRSQEGEPSLVIEATNGHIAIQVTTNNPEFEPDEFTLAFEPKEVKKWLKTGAMPQESSGRLPNIDEALIPTRAETGAEFTSSKIQMDFWTAANMALRAVFEENVDLHISAPQSVETTAMSVFAEGESRDGVLAVVEIFIMRKL